MTSISARPLDVPLRLRPPARLRRQAPRQGRSEGADEAAVGGAELEARFATPVAVADPTTGLVLARCGLQLRVDPRYEISWMRIQFEMSDSEVLAQFPTTVSRPAAYAGRLGVDANGAITRRPAFDDLAEKAYQPFIVAHAPRPCAVSWDFLPAPGLTPSCESLLFTTRANPAGLALTATLMLGVGLPDSSPDYFELTDDLVVR